MWLSLDIFLNYLDGKIDLRNSKEALSEVSSLLKVQRKFTSSKETSQKE